LHHSINVKNQWYDHLRKIKLEWKLYKNTIKVGSWI
jgi:hypothetical protein